MKQVHGWYLPSHEKHLAEWFEHPKNKLVLNGRRAYQGNKQVAALKYVKQHRVAVDVGAHVGFWSYNLVATFDHVHAFEPVAEHRACFTKNIERTGWAQDIDLHPIALGTAPGRVSMKTEQGSSGNTTIAEGDDVEMRTLDSFGFDNVDFMKLDCEGFEENVLRGAVETIKRCRPVIIVEQKRDFAARFGMAPGGAVAFLMELGYRVAEEISGDFVMVS